jgi:hypothetical protein
MGYVSYFYVDTKTFELPIEKGSMGLRIIERGRGVTRAVALGKSSVVRLEEVINREKLRDFYWIVRVGSGVYIVQRRTNTMGGTWCWRNMEGGASSLFQRAEKAKGRAYLLPS